MGTTSAETGCTDVLMDQSVDTVDKPLQWTYSVCHTPLINDIQPRRLYLSDTVTVSGHGFGEVSCENHVMMGTNSYNLVFFCERKPNMKIHKVPFLYDSIWTINLIEQIK